VAGQTLPERSEREAVVVVALFAACVFSSAFLLFLVQPMVGKRILPWFGGVPGVWTLCLAFYQVTLFLGYAYGHVLARFLSPRAQPWVHGVVLLAALAALPVLPGVEWRPEGAEGPTVRILAMLAVNVGVPFLFLSASGPLIQAWFVRAAPGRSPYVLYAVSNAGSFLALLSYPFLIEPAFPLTSASGAWSVGLLALGVPVLACAWLAGRSLPIGVPLHDAEQQGTRVAAGGTEPPAWWLWIALSACAVVLLMGVTNELCLDIASIPFLWVAPLAVYLVTFIVCFSAEAAPARPWVVGGAALSLFLWAWFGTSPLVSMTAGVGDIGTIIGLHTLLLLFHCLALHRDLYAIRPAPEQLTAYYLCISLGGALGGIFVGIGAPRWFSDYYELPIGLAACWVLLAVCWLRANAGTGFAWRRIAAAAAVAVATAIWLVWAPPDIKRPGQIVLQLRNFFGVLRVVDMEAPGSRGQHRRLNSGTTMHGLQFQYPPRRGMPSLYYSEFTGVGFAMRAVQQRGVARVGVVGLGVGTLAAYGRPGDVFRFYEIDPDVTQIARDPRWYTYLRDSRASVEIIPGDARLSLETEIEHRGSPQLDLLVLDAFSSDSIPVHLLTREAFAIYTQALRKDGLLAVHVSNANLELSPLVFRLGAAVGMEALVVSNREPARPMQARATWVLLARTPALLAAAESAATARRDATGDPFIRRGQPNDVATAPLFTDDFSDVFGLLKSR
jgi:hypothetical protein